MFRLACVALACRLASAYVEPKPILRRETPQVATDQAQLYEAGTKHEVGNSAEAQVASQELLSTLANDLGRAMRSEQTGGNAANKATLAQHEAKRTYHRFKKDAKADFQRFKLKMARKHSAEHLVKTDKAVKAAAKEMLAAFKDHVAAVNSFKDVVKQDRIRRNKAKDHVKSSVKRALGLVQDAKGLKGKAHNHAEKLEEMLQRVEENALKGTKAGKLEEVAGLVEDVGKSAAFPTQSEEGGEASLQESLQSAREALKATKVVKSVNKATGHRSNPELFSLEKFAKGLNNMVQSKKKAEAGADDLHEDEDASVSGAFDDLLPKLYSAYAHEPCPEE